MISQKNIEFQENLFKMLLNFFGLISVCKRRRVDVFYSSYFRVQIKHIFMKYFRGGSEKFQ